MFLSRLDQNDSRSISASAVGSTQRHWEGALLVSSQKMGHLSRSPSAPTIASTHQPLNGESPLSTYLLGVGHNFRETFEPAFTSVQPGQSDGFILRPTRQSTKQLLNFAHRGLSRAITNALRRGAGNPTPLFLKKVGDPTLRKNKIEQAVSQNARRRSLASAGTFLMPSRFAPPFPFPPPPSPSPPPAMKTPRDCNCYRLRNASVRGKR